MRKEDEEGKQVGVHRRSLKGGLEEMHNMPNAQCRAYVHMSTP